ncbi:SDR family oxidoreductase [Citrobacter portucalensis]|nr:SDR family NAD(P)-dependent oxidoreductase [Citrobacter portucalensis]MDN4358250.1 SDR family oxidoreductase [Citrobacter portucalensis]MDN4362463.1 SDR family oxidoreductase [Citrobacter portucalensis]MDN4372512.1 SDR family oxidoreductase [Citrobacter portucalensis]MDN4377791.1 SDR family oxidoreductase [Citrobacter portucalensis]MDN4388587.1 SDR family oxidoreductase [Citrobacter portucalensis]
MDLKLAGKVALVTGARTGIGFSICEELAANGVHLVMVARQKAELILAAQKIEDKYGVKALPFAGDVTDKRLPEQVVKQAEDIFQHIDLLVNNAGRAHTGTLLTTSEEDWLSMTETKLSAMRRFCKAVIPGMQARKWGRIVNISSIGGIYPNPQLTVSHALSAAINNLTRSLALSVAPDGILVNAVGVGAVATDNWAQNMLPNVRNRRPELADKRDEEVMALLGKEKTPVGRFGLPEDIAAITAFLLSDRNQFVTGQTIEASGGADRFM